MKIIAIALLCLNIIACTHTNQGIYTPQTYPVYDPNCHRHTPAIKNPNNPWTAKLPNYEEMTYHKKHCTP